ncbi:MAG: SURF1 family protein [Parvibaculum sp.]|uniref:SURF1 family protein n=1 Tax=Parvibaculum sp. TaxID=2024848 RepID=UPI0025DEF8A1|nr:SURF1 family protein [Parvibaculum sp.]MCE9649996.1 SURF1 family protein [Parvibaculum sp.]
MTTQTGNRFFRPMLWPTLVTLAALAILVGLGAWQLERLQWKLGLIATIEQRMAEPAAPVPVESAWSALDLKALEYRHLRLAGTFQNDKELHYFTQNDDGDPGYDIVTPLALAQGGVVLVDRGFVPLEKKDASTRAAGQIEGETSLTGVARAPQARGLFSNADDVAKNIWYTRDPKTMGEALKLEHVAPFYVEADGAPNAGGFPVGGRTQVNIRNEHLQYAITWFGLAAVLLAVYLSYHWSNGRIGRRKND